MTDNDDFKTLRRYTREEAAQLLHIPRRVTADRPGEDRSTDLAAASGAGISEDELAAFRDLRSISSRPTF